jgi:hypothetical protein
VEVAGIVLPATAAAWWPPELIFATYQQIIHTELMAKAHNARERLKQRLLQT